MCLNHQTDLVCFDCCVCLIAIPRMSSWAYAPREDLDAWNSKRVLSSPAPSPPIFVETLPISDGALSVAALEWSYSLPLVALLPPPTFPPLLSSSAIFSQSVGGGGARGRVGEGALAVTEELFLVLFIFFPPFHFLPFPSRFLEVVFGLGAVKGKEKGSVFLSRWKQPWNRQVHGPEQLLATCKLKRWASPSKPRALHIILSCNSHCNCRNPNC